MKKIISLICALMVVSGMTLAQRGEPVVIPLWPNGFRPNGTVIIACPGGGNKLNNRSRK